MAPDIATNHNFYHHKQSKISREQFQNAKENVAEPLLINNKLNQKVSNSSMSECDKSSEYNSVLNCLKVGAQTVFGDIM